MKKINNHHNKQPFIDYFEVKRLFGYKNIRIDFTNNITIAATENGNGKTTLLNIFYAVLNGNTDLLKKYEFDSISISFQGDDKPITLSYEELHSKYYNYSRLYRDSEKDSSISLELIEQDMIRVFGQEKVSKIFETINKYEKYHDYSRINKSLRELSLPSLPEELIQKIRFISSGKSIKLESIRKKIRDKNLEILYFPTYRRIESYSLDKIEDDEENSNLTYRKYGGINRRKIEKNRLMNFGLDDVDSQLNSICDEITQITLRTYSKIGRSILDELLSPKSSAHNNQSIEPKNLEFVLSRLDKGDKETVTKINKLIRTGDINKPENSALASLIVQLNEIYIKTEKNENAIENFSTVINSYWETNTPQEKEFIFDKTNVKTYVKNLITEDTLKLNSLSSGEKQIFSIFARLYLNTDNKNYIILIDEPELSLSLNWQRKFLVDITNAPSCHHLFAITHSPFIFENELAKYAKPFCIRNNAKREK